MEPRVWDAVCLEVSIANSCPVVLHSFRQLDPDQPHLESSTQEISEALINGAIYSSLHKVQLQHEASKGQRWLRELARLPRPAIMVFLPQPPKKLGLQCENETALNLQETCKVLTVKAGALEKLVQHLAPAFWGSDLFLCHCLLVHLQSLRLFFKDMSGSSPTAARTAGPRANSKPPSPLPWAPAWISTQRISVTLQTFPASSSWWLMCSSVCLARTWSTVPTFSWPS